MPTKEDHIAQAEHNHDFWTAYDIETTPYLDWVVVGMFYEAAHWVEAYLALQNKHSGSHYQREVSIKTDTILAQDSTLATDYGVLRTDSEAARYRGQKFTPSDIDNDLVPLINSVRTKIQALIASSPSSSSPTPTS